ncbi:MAG: TIGR02680 family protein, partial [Solirubrobacterales bacterium]|nr:TIGR02680 family protein [Solirubrobacterales bacterium]
MSALPTPARARWQPLRLGLVDLFYYDREELAFRDGRLLLRGNNGTGKSKVLALTLPFLLDGDLSAYRVEPDADPKKRMEWNLLLGGEHPHDERLGYAWLELGRRDDDGAAFCTIGCGMKAVKGRGIAAHWFFITDQRVGEELALVDATGVALTADRLEEAIGARGGVHRRARDYRRAIDERLFGLGELRYGALIDLLIKIRAPQLSRRPDERGLSAALTGALPPLDQALITDVAEAFRALEEDGEQLAAMVEAHDASERYLDTYRAYARMATRRRAAPVRGAQTVFDRISRELGEAEEQHARAQAELADAEQELEALRGEHTRLDARRQVLQDDPAARSARELRRAVEQAEQAARWRIEAQQGVDRVTQRAARLGARLSETESEAAAAHAELAATQREVAEQAEHACVAAPLAEALAEGEPAELRRRAERIAARQRGAIERVGALQGSWQRARDALGQARAGTERLASDHGEVSARREQARVRFREAGASYARGARAKLDAARELSLADPATVLAALEAWLETLAGENPLESAVSAAGRDAARRLERAQAETSARAEVARATVGELEREIDELQSGAHPTPPAPYTRDADAREQRAGAPLWQLVDFREELAPGERAGIEAALEAAGVLDGWVTPSGELLDPDTEDVLLDPARATPAGGANPAGPRRLTEALRPAIGDGADVGEADVRRLLDAIGLGESEDAVWVAASGRFRNGVLRGAWHKPAAAFIGHAAREAARRARLDELHERVTSARAELDALERQLAELARRQERLERELAELPPDAELRDADGAVAAAEDELTRLAERLDVARAHEQRAHELERDADATLRADAADLALPPGGEELRAVELALARMREGLAALWPALSERRRAEKARTRAAEDVRATESEHADAAARLTEAERHLAEATERRDTLKETAGAAIAELERQLGEVARAHEANTAAQRDTEARRGRAERADGAAEALSGELRQQLESATDSRLRAVDGLRRFATTGLIAVALAELEVPDPAEEWNVTQALRLAREIEQELSADGDEDTRWQRVQRQVTDELGALADALRRHGNNAAASFREEGIVVEVTFRARTTSLPELSAALAEEVQERRRLLDSREREILENHLVGEVASTLQELITAAEKRVADTNQELAQRPTSTGMRLRLRWTADPEGPDGLADARARLLRQTSDAWSESDRAAVSGFLQNQIKAVRAEDPTGPWLEHLTRALDYRAWHRFGVER